MGSSLLVSKLLECAGLEDANEAQLVRIRSLLKFLLPSKAIVCTEGCCVISPSATVAGALRHASAAASPWSLRRSGIQGLGTSHGPATRVCTWLTTPTVRVTSSSSCCRYRSCTCNEFLQLHCDLQLSAANIWDPVRYGEEEGPCGALERHVHVDG